MSELDPKIAELEARLDSLVRTQIDFQQEVTTIRRELSKLRTENRPQTPFQPSLITQPLNEQNPPPTQRIPPTPEPRREHESPLPRFGMNAEAASDDQT